MTRIKVKDYLDMVDRRFAAEVAEFCYVTESAEAGIAYVESALAYKECAHRVSGAWYEAAETDKAAGEGRIAKFTKAIKEATSKAIEWLKKVFDPMGIFYKIQQAAMTLFAKLPNAKNRKIEGWVHSSAVQQFVTSGGNDAVPDVAPTITLEAAIKEFAQLKNLNRALEALDKTASAKADSLDLSSPVHRIRETMKAVRNNLAKISAGLRITKTDEEKKAAEKKK